MKFVITTAFTTLQENMPNALGSVSVETIWKYEHRMKGGLWRWLGDQIQVKKFGCRVPSLVPKSSTSGRFWCESLN